MIDFIINGKHPQNYFTDVSGFAAQLNILNLQNPNQCQQRHHGYHSVI